MPPITIYTKMYCPYCEAAISLLRKKNAAFEEVAVDGDAAKQRAMAARAGGATSVPQIFIGGAHIGGCDDLHALEHSGRLDPMLAG